MEKYPIPSYLGPLPEEIDRPPIQPVEPIRRINVRSPEQERELITRFRSLPPELRTEVLRFHNDRNRQLFRELFNFIANVTIDINRPEDIPDSYEVMKIREDFQPLFRRYNLKTRIIYKWVPSYQGAVDLSFILDNNINSDIIPNEAIQDLIYKIIDLRDEGYVRFDKFSEVTDNINNLLREYSSPYRIVTYPKQFRVEN